MGHTSEHYIEDSLIQEWISSKILVCYSFYGDVCYNVQIEINKVTVLMDIYKYI